MSKILASWLVMGAALVSIHGCTCYYFFNGKTTPKGSTVRFHEKEWVSDGSVRVFQEDGVCRFKSEGKDIVLHGEFSIEK